MSFILMCMLAAQSAAPVEQDVPSPPEDVVVAPTPEPAPAAALPPAPPEEVVPSTNPDPEDALELPPAAQQAPQPKGRSLKWGVLGAAAMTGVELLLLPVGLVGVLAPAHFLNSLLTGVGYFAARLTFDAVQRNSFNPPGVFTSANFGAASFFVVFSMIPGLGSYFQGLCLGPSLFLAIPTLLFCGMPLAGGLGAMAARAVTHKRSPWDLAKAGLKGVALSGLLAWPLAAVVGGAWLLGSMAWAMGSLGYSNVVVDGPGLSEEEQAARAAATARYDQAAVGLHRLGTVMAVVGGGVALVGTVALGLESAWPLVDYLRNPQGARDEELR